MLPTSRNTTYNPASPAKSADFNAIQDCIIAGKHGQIVRKLPPTAGVYSASNGFGPWGWVPLNVLDNFYFPIVVYGGEVIQQVDVKVACGVTDAFTLQVWRNSPSGALTQLGATQASTGHAMAVEDLIVAAINETVVAGNDYVYAAQIQCSAKGAGTLKVLGALLTLSGS